MKTKVKTWLKRYIPSEIFGIIGLFLGGLIINALFHNPVLTALGGTWGENIGYYGNLVVRDLRKQKEKHKKITILIGIKTIRNLILEFGIGQYLDFIIRPFFMYLMPTILHNVPVGLFAGKLAADVTFYTPTIISYELRNKFLGE